jgi:membrane-bound ClpP family serine protease
MNALFVASAVGGTVLLVVFLLQGVERREREGAGRFRAPPVYLASVAIVALSFAAVVFGVVGFYSLARGVSLVAVVVGSVVLALLLGLGLGVLVWRWALRAHREELARGDESLQGLPARVTRLVDGRGGEVEYRDEGSMRRAPARSVDGSTHPVGTEVVIDRTEGDVVYVEAWSRVEERL